SKRDWRSDVCSSDLMKSFPGGRGFRPQLGSAPRFRFAPSRSWLSPHKNRKIKQEKCKHPSCFIFLFLRCSIAARKKTAVPAASRPQKQRFLSARSGVRTLDTLIKSQVLCQLS